MITARTFTQAFFIISLCLVTLFAHSNEQIPSELTTKYSYSNQLNYHFDPTLNKSLTDASLKEKEHNPASPAPPEPNHSLEKKLIVLETKFQALHENSSHSTINIMLACVSVIITILGVVIALISFYGFKNIKTDSIAAAISEAQKHVEQETPKIIENSLNTSLIELIEQGNFENAIKSAVEKVTYRDTSINLIDKEDEGK